MQSRPYPLKNMRPLLWQLDTAHSALQAAIDDPSTKFWECRVKLSCWFDREGPAHFLAMQLCPICAAINFSELTGNKLDSRSLSAVT